MPVSSDVIRFERHVKKLTDLFANDMQREMIEETAKVFQTSIRASIYGATNGGRLRNVGKNGARVGVRLQRGANSIVVQATGPLQLIERDTKAHQIPRSVGVRRRRTATGRLSHQRESTGRVLSARRPLFINGSWVTGPVNHPGTQGKYPFERGALAAEPAALTAARTIFARSLASVFNG